MTAKSLIAALLTGAVVLAGCGGGDDSATVSAAPEELLVKVRHLPAGAEVGGTPSEECNPIPIMEEEGGRATVGRVLYAGTTQISEAVAVFDGDEQATAAFENLSDPKRLECIQSSLGPTQFVDSLGSQSLDAGDENSVERFTVNGEKSEPLGYVDAVVIRTGPCVASLRTLVDSKTPDGKVSAQISDTAAERLADSCG